MIKKQFAFYRIILVFITLAFTFLVFGCVSVTDTDEITLSQDSVELDIGEDIQITATLNLDITGELTWTSDNPEIATVVNGKITAISEGVAVITVSLGDISATVNVTVTKPTIADLGVALDNSKYLNARINMELSASMMGETFFHETIIDIDGHNTHTRSNGLGYEFEQYATLIDNTVYSATRAKSGSEWMDWEIEILEFELESEIDFSMFLEDDFVFVDGYFELKENKINEYFDSLEFFEGIADSFDSFTLKIQLKDEFISKLIIEIEVSEENISSEITMNIDISNIGITEVVIPDEVLELFAD